LYSLTERSWEATINFTTTSIKWLPCAAAG